MAQSFNNVVLMGRLVKDPDVRATTSGKNVGTFTLAVDKYKEGANFIECEVWEKTAEFVKNYLEKGSQVLVSGSLEQKVWEKDGKKQSKLFVSAKTIQSISSVRKHEDEPLPTDEEMNKPINYDNIPF